MSESRNGMSTIENTLHVLVEEIGPRPASSDNERTAAEFIAGQFEEMGLAADIQDFATGSSFRIVRFFLYLLVVLSVVGIGYFSKITWLNWTLWLVLLGSCVIYWLETNGKPILSDRLHKGPSQNVVATFTPKSRSTEGATKKIVVMAHYDTCLVPVIPSSNPFFRILTFVNTYIMYVLPLLALVLVFKPKFMDSARMWVWYFLLVLAAIPLIYAFDTLATLLFKRYSSGANNNASGIAAILEAASLLTAGKIDAASTRKQQQRTHTSKFSSVHSSSEPLWTPDDEASGKTGKVDFPEDFSWAGGSKGDSSRPESDTSSKSSTSSKPIARPTENQKMLQFDTLDFDLIPEATSQPTVSFAPIRGEDTSFESERSSDAVLGRDLVGDSSRSSVRQKPTEKKSVLGGLFAKKNSSRAERRHAASSSDWLGLDDEFDARSAGKEIGSWDNFESKDDDDDGFAWKGGAAGGDYIEDPAFAASEAMRIRLKISEQFDSSLDGKELWFVATGSQYSMNAGIKSLLDLYPTELRNALFINVEAAGAGALYWRTGEGRTRLRKATVRLTGLARRVSRDENIRAKGIGRTGVETDATAVLRLGGKAITITRLDAKNNPANSCSMQDTLATVDPAVVEETARFIAAMVRGA